jgi:hypothetical protein
MSFIVQFRYVNSKKARDRTLTVICFTFLDFDLEFLKKV